MPTAAFLSLGSVCLAFGDGGDVVKVLENERLFTPSALQHPHNEGKFLKRINDFPLARTEEGWPNEVCAQYGGIDHSNRKACCRKECGDYCGAPDCHNGPGGREACCEGDMVHWCSIGQRAPCMLDVQRLAHVYYDRQCMSYTGIDDPTHRVCCPAGCGEFCGHDVWCWTVGGRVNGLDCCVENITSECGPLQKAPCVVPIAPPWYKQWRLILVVSVAVTGIAFLVGRKSVARMMSRHYSYVSMSRESVPEPHFERAVNFGHGLPLTWETKSGMKTVYALRRPLGLVFEKEQPIKITRTKDSHGRDIGIEAGWVLVAVDGVDIRSMRYKEAETIWYGAVTKLPMTMPLKFDTGAGEDTVWTTKNTLDCQLEEGTWRVTSVPEGHAKEIGIKNGWILKSVNYFDVSQVSSLNVLQHILLQQHAKLESGRASSLDASPRSPLASTTCTTNTPTSRSLSRGDASRRQLFMTAGSEAS